MAQLLKNSGLEWDGKTEFRQYPTDDLSSIKTVAIELPTHWQYITEPQEKQPNNVPQSLHTEDGMKLAYGDGKFKAGYAQIVDIPANQRLLLKVTYDLATGSPDIIYGQLIVDGALPIQSDRTLLKNTAEKLFVFSAAQAGNVTVKFMASSDYAVKPTDLYITEITLETVAADYGGDHMSVVVPYGAGTPAPTPSPVPTPVPVPSPVPTPITGVITLPMPFTVDAAALYRAIANFYAALAESFEAG
jgi:hypothetical protein